jgi:hypothetical protein
MELPYTLQLPPISLQKAKSSTELLSFDAPERKSAFNAYTAPEEGTRQPQTWKVGAELTISHIFSSVTLISLNFPPSPSSR